MKLIEILQTMVPFVESKNGHLGLCAAADFAADPAETQEYCALREAIEFTMEGRSVWFPHMIKIKTGEDCDGAWLKAVRLKWIEIAMVNVNATGSIGHITFSREELLEIRDEAL